MTGSSASGPKAVIMGRRVMPLKGQDQTSALKGIYRSRLENVLIDLPVLHDDDEVFGRILY